MLFSDEEIKSIHFLKNIARYLNNYYIFYNSHGEKSEGESSEKAGSTFNFYPIFKELKVKLKYTDEILIDYANVYSKDMLDSEIDIFNKDLVSKYGRYEYFLFSLSKNSMNKLFLSFLIDICNFILGLFSKGIYKNYYEDAPKSPFDLESVVNYFSDLLKSIDRIVLFENSNNNNNSEIYNKIIALEDNLGQILNKNIIFQEYIESSKNKITLLDDLATKLTHKVDLLKKEYNEEINKNFDKQRRAFENRANEALNSFKSSINDLISQYQVKLEPQISDLTTKLSTHKSELDSLLGDVKLYQDKMTNKAVNEMSAHYFDKSKFERNSYFAITLISAVIILFSVISAYRGVNSYYNEYVSTKTCDSSESRTIKVNGKKMEISFEQCMKDLSVKREATQKYAFNYLIFRLSFSLLLFLAVIYASRIAMRAYNHWRQSENMYLKLNTLSPFIGSLDKSVRNDVHLSLVPDYFGKDAGMVESSKDTVKDLPTNISNIAIKAIEQAGSTIGSKLGSDKETKNSDSEASTEKNKKKSADDPE